MERVPALWLSRSWTTRPPRPGETDSDYVFVDRPAFTAHAEAGGFLEWAEFLGHLYGTPRPDPPPGADVLLEIDLQGARQVLERHPDAVVMLLLPPSREVQETRLAERGDAPDHVAMRLAKGDEETREGRAITSHVVVNDDVGQAVSELAGIVARTRDRQRRRARGDEPDVLEEPEEN